MSHLSANSSLGITLLAQNDFMAFFMDSKAQNDFMAFFMDSNKQNKMWDKLCDNVRGG